MEMLTHTAEERKSLGVYYTPNDLSKVLCDWAIRRSNEAVLEPSFGGCGFLEASINRLRLLGSESPESRVYGADIDKRAFSFLYEKVGKHTQVKKRFIHDDFIKLVPDDFSCNEFDVLIGNPPYVSVHNMTERQRASCKQILGNSAFIDKTLGSNANLWAFFLVHSLSFLSSGGRMAWVLPSSALHADYAKKLLGVLELHFSNLNLIRLNDRLFKAAGADEVSVILLAENFSKNNFKSKAAFHIAKSVTDLADLIANPGWERRGLKNYKTCVIGAEIAALFHGKDEHKDSKTLKDFCDIKIGLVSGANNWFTLSFKKALKYKINHKQLKPIITKFSQFKGLEHTNEAHEVLKKSNSRAFLLCPKKLIKDSAVEKYLRGITRDERESNRTFGKRPLWFNPDDNNAPDGFLTYMFDRAALMVLNSDKVVNCTNSIHRVYFRSHVSREYARAISASLLSSYSRLSIELNGRAYGSGVQKIEPTAAKGIRLIVNGSLVKVINERWEEISELVKQGNIDEASLVVDKLICQNSECCTLPEMMKMREAAVSLRSCRYEMKHDKNS